MIITTNRSRRSIEINDWSFVLFHISDLGILGRFGSSSTQGTSQSFGTLNEPGTLPDRWLHVLPITKNTNQQPVWGIHLLHRGRFIRSHNWMCLFRRLPGCLDLVATDLYCTEFIDQEGLTSRNMFNKWLFCGEQSVGHGHRGLSVNDSRHVISGRPAT